MPRKASPLSSSFIGNFTWSYIFIHHMICVLLGAPIYFSRIFLLFFRRIFCIFYFNRSGNDSLCHAYFASILVAVSKQKVYRCCKKYLEKSENDKILKLFAYWALINILQHSIFLIILELGKYDESYILYRLYYFGRLLLCLHCLHMFAFLMILFEDRSIKYAEAFSMQCWITILVIFHNRVW